MTEYAFIKENLESIHNKIHVAVGRSGRSADAVRLLAVTKFHPLEAVTEAYACGIRHFGENRVQEAAGKYSPESRARMPDIAVDMIGTLQSNKINRALKVFDCIQSVGSLELLKAIDARVGERQKALDIYLELHTGEESKSGFPNPDALFQAVETYLDLRENVSGNSGRPHSLVLRGLMTMAPFTGDRSLIRTSFRTLATASEEIKKRFDLPEFGQLSMGMSNDYEIAIEEGSTLLRIGTAIFGARL
ncbi:MAG TPA: YggS family pyridoxal phosphate-dependent enzyme [Rectinemataceae bacterium]|nr:YggS family pyridoxal phosphate-dependent enzyme [Rectinemataceae bacterium]